MKNFTTIGAATAFVLLATLPIQGQTQQPAPPGAPMQQAQPAMQQNNAQQQQQQAQVKVINNTVCPVSDEAIGSMGAAKVVTHKGYQLNLCCNGCVKKFNKNPDAYLQAVLSANQTQPQPAVQQQTQGQPQPQVQQQQPQMQQQQQPQQQPQMQPQQPQQTQRSQQQVQQNAAVKPLNNTACPISGQPVGSMQAGSNIVYKGYQIGLCCDSCKAQFNKNPDQYLQAMLKAGTASTAAQARQ